MARAFWRCKSLASLAWWSTSEGLIKARMFSLVSPWPHNLGGPTTPQRVGGGVNNFHPIYLFNSTIFCVFLTAMNFMLGNPLPVEKGPQQLLVTYLWKSQGGKGWKLLVSALLVPESSRKQAVFFSYRAHHEAMLHFVYINVYVCTVLSVIVLTISLPGNLYAVTEL